MLYFYAAAFVTYAWLALADLSTKQWSSLAVIQYSIVIIPLLLKIHDQAKEEYLRYYFFFSRIRQRLTNPTSKWSLVVSFDGVKSSDALVALESLLLDGSEIRKEVVFHSKSNLTMDFSVDGTLHFFTEYHDANTVGTPESSISVKLGSLELGSNTAISKLEKEILPLLELFQKVFQARHVSYSLGISFLGLNPFYSRYLKNLKADAVSGFRINLIIGGAEIGAKDTVEINRDGVSIVANSIVSLRKLAEDFIFQSPNLKDILPDKNA